MTVDVIVDVSPDTAAVEICTNQADDDGDGKSDCDDNDCLAVVMCVPDPPDGWGAPAFLHSREPSQPVSCGAFVPGETLFDGLDALAATCSCKCGSPSGGTCGSPSTVLYSDGACDSLAAVLLSGQGCFAINTSTVLPGSIQPAEVNVLVPGLCQPAVQASMEPATWSEAIDVCRTQTFGGCDGGERCVLRPDAAMSKGPCLVRQGTAACPSAYPEARKVFAGVQDDRECLNSGCSCLPAAGGTCDGTVSIHSNGACNFAIRSWDMDGDCKATNFGPTEQPEAMNMTAKGPKGGTCSPVGGSVPSGAVTPADPYAVCCATGL